MLESNHGERHITGHRDDAPGRLTARATAIRGNVGARHEGRTAAPAGGVEHTERDQPLANHPRIVRASGELLSQETALLKRDPVQQFEVALQWDQIGDLVRRRRGAVLDLQLPVAQRVLPEGPRRRSSCYSPTTSAAAAVSNHKKKK